VGGKLLAGTSLRRSDIRHWLELRIDGELVVRKTGTGTGVFSFGY
jgi:hypothetical protein